MLLGMQVTHAFTLNPKSINMGELYGEYNLLTNEWTDGLASSIIRAAVSDTTWDRKWVVFDGPVDALWIENLNTGEGAGSEKLGVGDERWEFVAMTPEEPGSTRPDDGVSSSCCLVVDILEISKVISIIFYLYY